jgi:hypothetical protein
LQITNACSPHADIRQHVFNVPDPSKFLLRFENIHYQQPQPRVVHAALEATTFIHHSSSLRYRGQTMLKAAKNAAECQILGGICLDMRWLLVLRDIDPVDQVNFHLQVFAGFLWQKFDSDDGEFPYR